MVNLLYRKKEVLIVRHITNQIVQIEHILHKISLSLGVTKQVVQLKYADVNNHNQQK
jgi:hypothetical protein